MANTPAAMPDAPDVSWLPETLAEIAEVIGVEAALRIGQLKGGADCYIPAGVTDDHWLTKLIGREAAQKLCAHYRVIPASGQGQGVTLRLARGGLALARRRYYELRAQGESIAGCARICGVHKNTARAWEKNKTAMAAAKKRVKAKPLPLLDWLDKSAA